MKLKTALASLLAMSLSAGACATGPGPAGAGMPAITKAADLPGTKWKLPISGSKRDGRVIEFKRGERGYNAVLTKVGDQLDKVVGAYEGAVIMELVPDQATRTFTGIHHGPGHDEANVTCSLSASGDELKCNNEDWAWVRQS
jgi:hypothetical protein